MKKRKIEKEMKIAISIISLVLLLLSSLFDEAVSIQPESNLESNCYNFPDKDFSASNCIKCTYGSTPKILLPTGSDAIDFTLTSSKVYEKQFGFGINNITFSF